MIRGEQVNVLGGTVDHAVLADRTGPGRANTGDGSTTCDTRTGTFAPDPGFVGNWGWGEDGRLLFDHYDDSARRLMAMTVDGDLQDLTDPVKGEDVDSPFTLIAY